MPVRFHVCPPSIERQSHTPEHSATSAPSTAVESPNDRTVRQRSRPCSRPPTSCPQSANRRTRGSRPCSTLRVPTATSPSVSSVAHQTTLGAPPPLSERAPPIGAADNPTRSGEAIERDQTAPSVVRRKYPSPSLPTRAHVTPPSALERTPSSLEVRTRCCASSPQSRPSTSLALQQGSGSGSTSRRRSAFAKSTCRRRTTRRSPHPKWSR